MTPGDLLAGATRWTTLGAVALAAPGGWLGGAPGGVGVLAGAALALGPLHWFARRAVRQEADGRITVSPWLMAAGLRFAGVSAAVAALFATGWAHPVALLAGYTVLPVTVVVQGLGRARAELRP